MPDNLLRDTTDDMPATNTTADLFNVNGMVAVITGGGSGIGLYAARALDANGAKAVYIVGRRAESLRAAAATGVNGTIKPLVGDVTSKDSLAAVVKQVEAEQGFVNLLYANAGVGGPVQVRELEEAAGDKAAPTVEEFSRSMFEAGDMESFTQALHVNCTGVFFTVAAFLPLLAKGNEKRNLPQDSQVLVTVSALPLPAAREARALHMYICSCARLRRIQRTSRLIYERSLR